MPVHNTYYKTAPPPNPLPPKNKQFDISCMELQEWRGGDDILSNFMLNACTQPWQSERLNPNRIAEVAPANPDILQKLT